MRSKPKPRTEWARPAAQYGATKGCEVNDVDKCKSCLMLREVRKLKVEKISFEDHEEFPAYCRKCYQDEIAKPKPQYLKLPDLDSFRVMINESVPTGQIWFATQEELQLALNYSRNQLEQALKEAPAANERKEQ